MQCFLVFLIAISGCVEDKTDQHFSGTVISHVRNSHTNNGVTEYILILQNDAVSMMVLTDADTYYQTKEGDKITFSKSNWDGTYYKYSK